MNTAILLIVRYDAQTVIPVSQVVEDYFPHLTVEKFIRKTAVGDIKLPLIRMDASSQKTAKGVHLIDLAKYIDDCRDVAAEAVRARPERTRVTT